MSEKITTLHLETDSSVEVYPNIKSDNIPTGAVTTTKIAGGAVTPAKLSTHTYRHDIYTAYAGLHLEIYIQPLLQYSEPITSIQEVVGRLYEYYGAGSRFTCTGLHGDDIINRIDIIDRRTIRVFFISASDLSYSYVDLVVSTEYSTTDSVVLIY